MKIVLSAVNNDYDFSRRGCSLDDTVHTPDKAFTAVVNRHAN
jgi:hypothetical protein